jgi:hypothetical protein
MEFGEFRERSIEKVASKLYLNGIIYAPNRPGVRNP